MQTETPTNLSQSTGHDRFSRLPLILVGPLAVLLAGAVVSCSSVKTQSQFSSAAAEPISTRHLMVVGLDERPAVREQFEKQFVELWKVHQVACATSCERFTLAELTGDRQTIRAKLEQAGIDAVLVVRAKDRAKTGAETTDSLYNGGLGFVSEGDARFLATSPTSSGVTIRLTVSGRLFTVGDGAMRWSTLAKTAMREGIDQDAAVRELAAAIANQLRMDKVFK